MLPKARFLDPRQRREAVARPIAEAANIPLGELEARSHELPPKDAVILVAAAPSLAGDAIEELERLGRTARRIEPTGDIAYVERRLWEPNGLLLEYLAGVDPRRGRRAIDVGCGTGRDAIYLAAAGWRVRAIDHLEDALVRGRLTADRVLGDADAIEWGNQEANGKVPDVFDLVNLFFVSGEAPLLYAASAVRPGGTLLVETFTEVHRAVHGRPHSILAAKRVVELLGDFVLVHQESAWHDGRHTLRIFAQRGVQPA